MSFAKQTADSAMSWKNFSEARRSAAENAAQEALAAATRQWPSEGVPDYPKGWLIRVASRRLVDGWRSEQARIGREVELGRRTRVYDPLAQVTISDVRQRDDSLTGLLLCCHPALARPSQVAGPKPLGPGLASRRPWFGGAGRP